MIKRDHCLYRSICVFIIITCLLISTVLPLSGAYTVQAFPDDFPYQDDVLYHSKPLVVAFDPHLPPFQFIDEGENKGFHIEIMDRIGHLEGLSIQYVPMNLEESIEELQKGTVDIILGVPYTASLHEDLDFTERYFTSSIGLIVPSGTKDINGIADLSNKVVALQRGTVEYEFLRNIRRVKYQVTDDQVTALNVLQMGRADAFVGNRFTAEYILKQQGIKDEYVFIDDYIVPMEYSMAVQKGNYQLLGTLNRGLQSIKNSGEYSTLYNEWFVDSQARLVNQLQNLIKIFVLILIVVVIIIWLGIRWNRQLQKEVDKKTNDLKIANQSLEYQVEQTKNNIQLKNQILDSSPRGIITTNRQGLITSVNPMAMAILSPSNVTLSMHYREVPLVQQLLSKKIETVFYNGNQYIGEEFTWQNRDGEKLFLRYYVYPLYTFEKEINGCILTFEDVTKEHKLREQLFFQEKNRALSQLVAGIAHEIRNPLTSIKTFVELIPHKFENETFRKEISTHVPKEINRLNQLIESLIDYAKPLKSKKELITVNDLIQSCLILFKRTITEKGFTLSIDVPEGLRIYGDSNQLKQVMINFILNSIDALEEKQKLQLEGVTPSNRHLPLQLRISAAQSTQSITITVVDNGVGMTNEEILKATEPFYTTKAKGTGLGLALSNQYIQENDGELYIESEKNKGTAIKLHFPKRRSA